MGKDSLTKSTTTQKSKKKEAPKASAAKIKATPKAAVKSAPKTAKQSKKTTAKTTTGKTRPAAKPKAKAASKPKTKSAAKPKSKPKAKAKPAAKKPAKKPTVRELLKKSFSPISKVAKPQSVASPKVKAPSAPPWVSAADPKETERIRALLLKSHNMEDVKASAKPVAAEPAVAPMTEKVKAVKKETSSKAAPAAAPEPVETPMVTTDVPSATTSDPFSKAAKMMAAGMGIVILLVLLTSHNNSTKYYIQPKDNAIEIWKGQFSPKDKEFYMVLHGTQFEGKLKDVYAQADVFPLIFSYFLNKADTLLEVPGLPDFDGIKAYLYQARKYASDDNMRNGVQVRLNNIERMILLYKADVAISKGTPDSLDNGLDYLKSAQKLITNGAQKQEIQQKISLAQSLREALKNK